MATLAKLAAILLVISAWGALQYTLPEFSGTPNESAAYENNSSTKTKVELAFSYEQESNPKEEVVVDDFQQVKKGSFFFKHNEQDQAQWRLSPLLNTDLKLNVSGLVARAKLTQTFSNDSTEWLNGIYVFPLPENAAVDHLEMRIGDRVIKGQIHTKSKARKIYQRAKNEGKKASLLEQQKPNLFVNSVTNIGPGESIEVSIEYQQPVQFDDGQFSLRFPMTVTPRYMPADYRPVHTGEDGWNTQQKESIASTATEFSAIYDEGNSNQVSISAHIDAGLPLAAISSEFHQIQTRSLAEGVYAIKLEDQAIANKDFVLSWKVSADNVPQAAHFQQTIGEHKYGLIMLVPPKFEQVEQQLARQLTFILDTSGSMAGEPLRQAKLALQYAIEQLTEQDHFNVIEFNSDARAIWSFSRSANSENKQSAKEFIHGLESNGGTNMLSALNLAMGSDSDSAETLVTQVIFITDGSVANDTELMAYIKNRLGNKRLFTVGIGAAPNGYFMQEAARVGRGTFTFIGSVNAVEEKMYTLFNKIRHPVLTDLTADFAEDVEYYPSVIPDLYLGEPLLLSYRTTEKLDKLFVSGSTSEENWAVELDARVAGEKNGLDVLWARRKIAQLSRDRLTHYDAHTLNKQIEQLALEHHLVSEFTSLVAVDVTPTALSESKDGQVPNHRPLPENGQALVGKLPKTATSAPMHLLLSFLLTGAALCFYTRLNPVR